MKWKALRPYVISVVLVLAASGIVGWITSEAMAAYEAVSKSPLTPPSSVFPIVWTVLYILMGIGAAMVWRSDAPGRTRALKIYAVQLIVNLFWSILFFNLQMYGLAFFWLLFLLVLIVLMIVSFWRVSPTAAMLQIPYLIWVSFAGYLAYSVWVLN